MGDCGARQRRRRAELGSRRRRTFKCLQHLTHALACLLERALPLIRRDLSYTPVPPVTKNLTQTMNEDKDERRPLVAEGRESVFGESEGGREGGGITILFLYARFLRSAARGSEEWEGGW